MMRKRHPSSSSSSSQSLGQVFTNHHAAKAFRSKRLNSIVNDPNHKKLRVVFLNQTEQNLTLCWVDNHGGLHHYYTLKPCSKVITGMGRNDMTVRLRGTHMENTRIGHSFVIGICDGNESNTKNIGNIIAGYRPTEHTCTHAADDDAAEDKDSISEEESCVHFVTISKSEYPVWYRSKSRLKKRNQNFQVQVSRGEVDETPLDTSMKVYEEKMIGKWKCRCEEGLFSGNKKDQLAKEIQKRLESDLLAASKKLPPKACEVLRENTPIWINKCQKFGPACAPFRGRGMCFHPESKWLVRNGMSPDKCGGVELYEADRYLDDVDLWYGKGGVMIHELSHAYHCKIIENGYDNEEIKRCYEEAMREKLYDAVEVHNKDGGKNICRAYACTDPMEYFAELSTAFLGGVGDDKDLEFNKWYPFNRKQIKEHDPRAYEMLQKMWYHVLV